MNTININGVTFNVIKRHDMVSAHQRYLELYFKDSCSLEECYDKPSATKREIYNKWREWWKDSKCKGIITDVHWCGIRSFNGWGFTLSAVFTYNGIDYIMDVSKAHNNLYQASV